MPVLISGRHASLDSERKSGLTFRQKPGIGIGIENREWLLQLQKVNPDISLPIPKIRDQEPFREPFQEPFRE